MQPTAGNNIKTQFLQLIWPETPVFGKIMKKKLLKKNDISPHN